MYLIDTNIFLEILLKQEKSNQSKKILSLQNSNDLYLTTFSLHSICVVMINENLQNELKLFLATGIKDKINILSVKSEDLNLIIDNTNKYNLDFDDAYQYTAAKLYNLHLVSYDKDFDKTDIKRIEP